MFIANDIFGVFGCEHALKSIGFDCLYGRSGSATLKSIPSQGGQYEVPRMSSNSIRSLSSEEGPTSRITLNNNVGKVLHACHRKSRLPQARKSDYHIMILESGWHSAAALMRHLHPASLPVEAVCLGTPNDGGANLRKVDEFNPSHPIADDSSRASEAPIASCSCSKAWPRWHRRLLHSTAIIILTSAPDTAPVES